ncbi:MAG: hypothetical protein WCC60_08520 [Ilumatobacteraceae bacterium]
MEVAVEEIVERLRRQIAQRRQNGDYPIGLEAELEAEFDGILAAMRRRELNTDGLSGHVDSLRHRVDEVVGLTPTTSGIPGGAAVHRLVGRLIGRQTTGLAAGVRAVGYEAVDALVEVVRLLEAQRSADERQLTEVVAAVIDRLTVIDQLVSSVTEIERRLDAIDTPVADES